MKIPKLFKKAAAFVMAAVTALSIMPATAFAAGDIGTIFFSHTYDSNGNAMRYNSSANIGGYTAGGTGNYKYRMFVDGENAFCIQPGVPLKTGNTLKKASSDTWNALSANQKKAVGLALLYGYQGNRNNLSGSDDEKWLATQTLVWEFVTGCREATGSYNQTSTTVYSLHFGSNYANSGARAVYDQIVANDVNEQVIKGNIALIKHTDNGETQIETPEEGAVFEVFLKSAGSYENAKETERDVLTCDENGFAQTKDMPYGIYTVRQTFGWEGRELMKDFDVFISKDGQTYRYLINNANFAIELFTDGSLNTFAKHTNVDTHSRLICYDILDLGKQLQPIGMLVVLDSILNRITQNRAKGRNTFIFIDEIYLLFQHEYSANFLFTLWKRVRKYGAYCTGITQNVDDLLQSHTARTMLAIITMQRWTSRRKPLRRLPRW